MHYVLSPKQMRQVDKTSSYDFFIPSIILMEHAGQAVLRQIIKDLPVASRIAIIVGNGNNGGDGLALARLLFQKNYRVKVYLITDLENLTADATLNYNILHALNIACQFVDRVQDGLVEEWQAADLLVDAILGSGCDRELSPFYQEVIRAINQCSSLTYSIDIPSGLHGERGMPMGAAVKADKTIVLAAYKSGNLLGQAKVYSGQMQVEDIGIPRPAYEKIEVDLYHLTEEAWTGFPYTNPLANKGTKGKVLIVGGSKHMGGALILACQAAYASGVGLVYAYTTENNYGPLLTKVPEVIINTYSDDRQVEKQEFYEEISDKEAILIGPGLSTSAEAYGLLERVLASKLPLVLDADALNLMADHPNLLHLCSQRKEVKILTPHLKEMERLTGLSLQQIQENSLDLARHYARHWNAILVLKNYRTIIAFPNGKCYINTLGNEGMATGGSGDVLAGYLAGLVAGARPEDYDKAVLYGVYKHSLAGDISAGQKGTMAMLAGHIIQNL